MSEDPLETLRQRILVPWSVHSGSKIWAAYGTTGWSPIDVVEVNQVWGHGRVVKPSDGSDKCKRKFKLSRTLKRDPGKKGKDKPGLPPSVVFERLITMEEEERKRKEECAMAEPTEPTVEEPPPEPTPPSSKEEEAKALERIQRLLDLLGDDSTVDDW